MSAVETSLSPTVRGVLRPLGTRILVAPALRKTRSAESLIQFPEQYDTPDMKIWHVVAVSRNVTDVFPRQIIVTHSYSDGAEKLEDGSGRYFIKRDQVIALFSSEHQIEIPQPK